MATGATDELRVPLLGGEDELEVVDEEALEDVEVDFRIIDGGQNFMEDEVKEKSVLSKTGSRNSAGLMQSREGTKKMQFSGSEMIVAVFVVAFDTKKGNTVEWKYPPEVVLDDNIEFKSMASGLHNITTDFIYFKQNQLYGLSCYEKIPVASEQERGARMKSVGLLAVGYSDLHLHMDFLKRQVRMHVEVPGDYGSLEEYFTHYRNPRTPSGISGNHAPNSLSPSNGQLLPLGCLSQLLQFYESKIFILWKLALLKKRILFFSPPPIGEVCHRVYATCLLTDQVYRKDLDTDPSPQFYVNVADIDRLRDLDSYVACTTEKIFQTKTDLYDVFIDGQDFHYSSQGIIPITRTTPIDGRKYMHLSNVRSADIRQQAKDDLTFSEYFTEQTSQLLRVMMDAADSEDHILTVEMVEGVQLDPDRDRLFLTALAQVWGLNVTVQHSTDVLTCCL